MNLRTLLPLLLLLPLAACKVNPATGERELDIVAVRNELHMVRMDIESAATILAADNPDLQARLAEGVKAADAVGLALDRWLAAHDEQSHADLLAATALAFDIADELVTAFADDGKNATNLRLALFAAEAVLRRVEAYTAA
jgi:hypothetical protein